MNKQQTAQLLTYLAELDGRKVTAATVEAWWDVLGGYSLKDCRQAVIDHNRESADFIKPGHIGIRVRDMEKRRMSRAGIVSVYDAVSMADEDNRDQASRDIAAAAKSGMLGANSIRAYQESGKTFREFMAGYNPERKMIA